VLNGVYGQKFNATGAPQWGADGLVIVPLGNDQQNLCADRAGWIGKRLRFG